MATSTIYRDFKPVNITNPITFNSDISVGQQFAVVYGKLVILFINIYVNSAYTVGIQMGTIKSGLIPAYLSGNFMGYFNDTSKGMKFRINTDGKCYHDGNTALSIGWYSGFVTYLRK